MASVIAPRSTVKTWYCMWVTRIRLSYHPPREFHSKQTLRPVKSRSRVITSKLSVRSLRISGRYARLSHIMKRASNTWVRESAIRPGKQVRYKQWQKNHVQKLEFAGMLAFVRMSQEPWNARV